MAKILSREQFESLLSERPDDIDEDTARSVLEQEFKNSGFEIETRYRHEIEKQGRDEWAAQNPKSAMVNRAARFGNFVSENIMGPIAEGVNRLDEYTDAGVLGGVKKMQHLNPFYNLGRGAMKLGGMVREEGRSIEASADSALTSKYSTEASRNMAQGKRALGILAQNSPIPETPGEAALATGMAMIGKMAPDLGLKATNKVGNAIKQSPEGVSKLEIKLRQPLGDNSVSRAWGAGASRAFDLPRAEAAFIQRVKGFGDKMLELTKEQKYNNQILQHTEENILRPSPKLEDFGKYGDRVVVELNTKTNIDKTPLAARSVALKELANKYTEREAPVLVVEGAKSLKSDIMGVINTTEDVATKKLLSSYTDLEYTPSELAKAEAMGMDVSKVGLIRSKSISDLLADRGDLGKLYVRLRETDIKDTPGSRAALKLQSLVDEEIARRINQGEAKAMSIYNDEMAAQEYQKLGVQNLGVPPKAGAIERGGLEVARADRRASYENLQKAKADLARYRESLGDEPALADPRYERNLAKYASKVKEAEQAIKAAKDTDLAARATARQETGTAPTESELPSTDSNIPIEKPRTGLVQDFAELRSDWNKFYKRQYSDTANSMRKTVGSKVIDEVFHSPESISEAQAAMTPEAFDGLVRTKTRLLVEELRASRNPVTLIQNAKKFPPGYWERMYGPHGSEALMSFAEKMYDNKVIERKISALQRGQPDLLSRRAGESLKNEYLKRPTDSRTALIANSLRGGALLSSIYWAVGPHPWVVLAAGAVGVAPEILARTYIKAGPSMRLAIEGLAKQRPGLGKMAGASNATAVLAFITATMAEEEKAMETQASPKKYENTADIPDQLRGKSSPSPLQPPKLEDDNETYDWPVR